MSEKSAKSSSDDTLACDSQLKGFAAFWERLNFCCCRLSKRASNYDLTSRSKNNKEHQDKPSYDNQALQMEKQARSEKLNKIAKTLPSGRANQTRGMRKPAETAQHPARLSANITQGTPRSGISSVQGRTPKNISTTRTAISTVNKPSALISTIKNKAGDADETTTGFYFTNSDSSMKKKTMHLLFCV